MEKQQTEFYAEDGIDLFVCFQLFWDQKWNIFFIINCVLMITTIYTFWIVGDVYYAQATVMSRSSDRNSITALKDIIPAGIEAFLPIREKGTGWVINMLRSRRIAEVITRHLNLVDILYAEVPPEKRPPFQKIVATLQNSVESSNTSNGLTQIAAKAGSPQLAADIANAYALYLRWSLKKDVSTTSRENRIFIAEQHRNAFQNLEEKEQQLQTFRDKHKLFALSLQTQEVIDRLSATKVQLTAKQAQLNVFKRLKIGPHNPQYTTLTFEIEELKRQIEELAGEMDNPTKLNPFSFQLLPKLEKELSHLGREKTIQENIYISLTQQYEQAKIAEQMNEINFLILDSAVPELPDENILRIPKEARFFVWGIMLGVTLAVAYVILKNFIALIIVRVRSFDENSTL